jgi:hypothetical protein
VVISYQNDVSTIRGKSTLWNRWANQWRCEDYFGKEGREEGRKERRERQRKSKIETQRKQERTSKLKLHKPKSLSKGKEKHGNRSFKPKKKSD